MAQYHVGSNVILADTNAHGVVVEVKPARRGRQIYRVSFPDGVSDVLEPDLRADFDSTDPFDCCKSGLFGTYADFSKINTTFKIQNSNNSTISSLKASKFTIEEDKRNPKNNKLRVYDFKSINKGLNYLTNTSSLSDNERTDSNVRSTSELVSSAINNFKSEMNNICSSLRGRLYKEFKIQGDLPDETFDRALKNRPIVYTGGGSSFALLRHGYHGFKDVIHISQKNWKTSVIEDLTTIISLDLCPILSTAYGLSISRPNDTIICEPFRDLFSGIRQTKGQKKEQQSKKPKKAFGHDIGGSHGFSYMDDWDAWK